MELARSSRFIQVNEVGILTEFRRYVWELVEFIRHIFRSLDFNVKTRAMLIRLGELFVRI